MCKIFKKSLKQVQSNEAMSILGLYYPHLLKQIFFRKTIHIIFMNIHIGPFHCAKFLKPLSGSFSERKNYFWDQADQLPQTKIGLEKVT